MGRYKDYDREPKRSGYDDDQKLTTEHLEFGQIIRVRVRASIAIG